LPQQPEEFDWPQVEEFQVAIREMKLFFTNIEGRVVKISGGPSVDGPKPLIHMEHH